jgi:non-homologous end joining protein Ku
VTPDELKLPHGILERMSDGAFEPDKYQDDYRLRVLAMIDEKFKGHEITAAPKPGPVLRPSSRIKFRA